MTVLLKNLNQIKTTDLGIIRIQENLKLDNEAVLSWCLKAIKQADLIYEHGKNYYVYYQGKVITVNRYSYTIITAHPIHPQIKVMTHEETDCLSEFLYQAIYRPQEKPPISRKILQQPEIARYMIDFGQHNGDFGVVAVQNGHIVGAAWTRIMKSSYGFVNDETPELVISVLPAFQSLGIGTRLMRKLFQLLVTQGYQQTSLSVQKENPAFQFYLKLGYQIYNEQVSSVTMIKYLK